MKVIFWSFILFQACTTAPKKVDLVEVSVQQKSVVTHGDGSTSEVGPGGTVTLTSLPAIVESPGHVGVLITSLPTEARGQRLDIKLRPIESWASESFNRKLTSQVTEITSTINEVQVLVSRNRSEEALEKITGLERKYAEIKWLGFMRASVLTTLRRYPEAKAALRVALDEFPNEKSGRDLHQMLEGRSPSHAGRSE